MHIFHNGKDKVTCAGYMSRYFFNRTLQVLRDQSIISLPSQFLQDLHWSQIFLWQFNGVTMYDVKPIAADIFLNTPLNSLGGAGDMPTFLFQGVPGLLPPFVSIWPLSPTIILGVWVLLLVFIAICI